MAPGRAHYITVLPKLYSERVRLSDKTINFLFSFLRNQKRAIIMHINHIFNVHYIMPVSTWHYRVILAMTP